MATKSGSALVVGAGISGMRAALDLAETGYRVFLVDKAPHIGGILEQLDHQFPTNRCGMCRMLPSTEPDQANQQCLRRGLFHDHIEVLPATEVKGVSGEAGRFEVLLRQHPTLVDPNRCVGCGACASACPVEVKDEFNAGLSTRKAIYRPAPQALPGTFVIDLSACTHCEKCIPVCPTGAIRMATADRGKFKILVVDDEMIVRDSLRALLADEGFAAEMAESGEAALEKLKAGPYHLMLLDIKMPGMEGVEVLKEAMALSPELQVVMMTAYATIETAVETMKEGAVDYLVKPFDPEALLPQIYRLYEESGDSRERSIEVGSVVLATGCHYFDPADEKDVFGYGKYQNVLTHLEFERLISGTGPCGGELLRPSDNRPARKIAWIQCVGSRDLQADADFCSSICCMSAVKEAMLARQLSGGEVETVIFYMDMRVFEKPFQQYLDEAESLGVQLQRCRVHSVVDAGDQEHLLIRYMDEGGAHQAQFDMVVLSVGQRPGPGAEKFSEMMELDLNPWGFPVPRPFSLTRTAKPGIFLGGAVSGLTDINEALIRSGAAACAASQAIHAAGGSLEPVDEAGADIRDISREVPGVQVVICTCGTRLSSLLDTAALAGRLQGNPAVCGLTEADQLCTGDGWDSLLAELKGRSCNRVLLATCTPNACAPKSRELAEALGLPEAAVSVQDLLPGEAIAADSDSEKTRDSAALLERRLKMAIAGLKRINPSPPESVDIERSALVIGGGIAGMSAALAIAGHGYRVDLVEKSDGLGGNLKWLSRTIDGRDVPAFLKSVIGEVEAHSLIRVHLNTTVAALHGSIGRFQSTLSQGEDQAEASDALRHGVIVLATGGEPAATENYGYGTSPAVMTQQEFETARSGERMDAGALSAVAMIQCVDCREPPRNYCSRVCCLSALKHALDLKEQNPDLAVYILYRDMMTQGFLETYYTRARQQGVVFFPYAVDAKPEVSLPEKDGEDARAVTIRTLDPILGQRVEISADLLVLATGITPVLPASLMAAVGAQVDEHGFFREADFKWRPVESLAAGVFACGLALSPRSIDDSIASAEAAAMRAVRVISREQMRAGSRMAVVRHSLCSACRLCLSVCPFDAREIDAETGQIAVHPLKCQGCGACAAICPNSATIMSRGSEGEMFEVIDAALGAL